MYFLCKYVNGLHGECLERQRLGAQRTPMEDQLEDFKRFLDDALREAEAAAHREAQAANEEETEAGRRIQVQAGIADDVVDLHEAQGNAGRVAAEPENLMYDPLSKAEQLRRNKFESIAQLRRVQLSLDEDMRESTCVLCLQSVVGAMRCMACHHTLICQRCYDNPAAHLSVTQRCPTCQAPAPGYTFRPHDFGRAAHGVL